MNVAHLTCADADQAQVFVFDEPAKDVTSIGLHMLTCFERRDPDAIKTLELEALIQEQFYSDMNAHFAEPVLPGVLGRAANDLASLGLSAVPAGSPMSMGGPSFVTMMLTDFGQSFMTFIRKPIRDTD